MARELLDGAWLMSDHIEAHTLSVERMMQGMAEQVRSIKDRRIAIVAAMIGQGDCIPSNALAAQIVAVLDAIQER